VTTLQAIILSIVEGLTEYLPISSTGHMIITSSFMGIASDEFTKNFTIIVQFGAILSVLAIYWRRFFTSKKIYLNLLVAFLPAAVIGLAVKKKIDLLLDNATVVASTLIIGGFVLIFIDRFFAEQESILSENKQGKLNDLDFRRAGLIGFAQCLAFIPGTSRSAASIIGGLGAKLTREAAAEFSFLLAVPTLTAATAYKVLHIYKTIQPDQVSILVIGNIISFIVGAITIKTFLNYLTKHGFFWFGVYRILVGTIILGLLLSGHSLETL
jgi:undecaprenyl-diphosphatase